MKLDITLKITSQMLSDAQNSTDKSLAGHLGTHFDVMNKEFPLEYTQRPGVAFDVSHVRDRDIDLTDVDLTRVQPDMFVVFYSGFSEEEPYGTRRYFKEHPQLSDQLIDALLEKHISIIGIDFAGVRRGQQHVPKDQYCADRGVFIIENLRSLKAVLESGGTFTAHTYPLRCEALTGLPCRVIAEI